MGRNDKSAPAEVVDRLLWRDAQQMLSRHAEPGPDDRCRWCGWEWPCPPRRLAERADEESRRPWPGGSLAGPAARGNLRPMPSARPDPDRPVNGRLFD